MFIRPTFGSAGMLLIILLSVATVSDAEDLLGLPPVDKNKLPQASLLTQMDEGIKLLQELQKRGGLSAAEMTQLQNLFRTLSDNLAKRRGDDPEATLCQELKGVLKDKLAENKDDRTLLLKLGWFYLLKDEPDRALGYFKDAGAASEQDVFHPLIMAYTYLRLGDYRPATEWMKLAETKFGTYTPLRLSTPVLCSQISGYRLYTPLPATQTISPGDDVLAYIEIDGAAFSKNGTQEACNLQFGLTLRDDLQQTIWSEPSYGTLHDSYQGSIRDLHTMINIHVPNNLVPGRYILLIDCTDQIGNKTAQTYLAFPVLTQGRKGSGSVPQPIRPEASQDNDKKTAEKKQLEDPFRMLNKEAKLLPPPELE